MRKFPVPVPERMKYLPVDARGYPVPKFVDWIDGEPDFRLISSEHMRKCIRHDRCWLCGGPLGKFKAFVIGPMCGVNRISAEPPSHLECAHFAVVVCPFLSRPMAKRNDRNLPKHLEVAGTMIARNPGVTLLWVANGFRVMREGHGLLFEIGDPQKVEFWREGRNASRAEVEHSTVTGLPILQALAEQEGPRAMRQLRREIIRYEALLDRVLPRLDEVTYPMDWDHWTDRADHEQLDTAELIKAHFGGRP